MRICPDISGYSHFRRGMPEAVRTVTRARSVLVAAILLGEWVPGWRPSAVGAGRERHTTPHRVGTQVRTPVERSVLA